MAGSIVIGVRELELLRDRMMRASEAELDGVLSEIGQTLEDSARRRISETKRSPSGQRWDPWSRRYAKTRGPQHSLLVGTGNLRDSLTHQIDSSRYEVTVGSNLVYAGRHLFGDDEGAGGIPARPYLDTDGEISDPSDRQEIREIVREFLRELLT